MLLELGLTPMHEDEAPMFTCSDSIALVQDCQLSWLHTNYSSWMVKQRADKAANWNLKTAWHNWSIAAKWLRTRHLERTKIPL